jgi:hypothetical protein
MRMHELRSRYNAIHSAVDTSGKLLLDMMRHPNANKEEVWLARQSYLSVYQQWIAVRQVLQEKHPPRQMNMFPEPWNKPTPR